MHYAVININCHFCWKQLPAVRSEQWDWTEEKLAINNELKLTKTP